MRTYLALILFLCTCVPAKILAEPSIDVIGWGIGLVSDGVCTQSSDPLDCFALDGVIELTVAPGAEVATFLQWQNTGVTDILEVTAINDQGNRVIDNVTEVLEPEKTAFGVGFITAPTLPGVYTYLVTVTATNAENRQGTDQVRYTLIVDAALPVTLTYFNATVDKSTVNLSWATSLEENHAGFSLERKDNLGTFLPLSGTIHQVTGTAETQYSFQDENAPHGEVFYRLQQWDFSGAITYSPIVQVSIAPEPWHPYPNPVVRRLRLPAAISATLYDATGVKLQQKPVGQEALDMSSLPAGTYWLQTEQSVYPIIKR